MRDYSFVIAMSPAIVVFCFGLFLLLVGCAARDPYITSNPKHISNYL